MNASRSDMFRKLLQKDPNNPMILYSLGNELFKEDHYAEARDLLQRAIENKSDYSVAYRMLGRAHFELHENTEARSAFLKGKEVARKNGDLQTVKEIDVFMRRLEKREVGEG
jgi:predicted Zn-dependent protease